MDNGTAFLIAFYGAAGSGALFAWWHYGRKSKGFSKVRCSRRNMHDTLTFHRVAQADAEALVSAHQGGNRGPQLLTMKGGGQASVDVGDFVAVEIA